MAKLTCRLVDAGIDYLTVTTPPGGSTDELLQTGYEVSNELFNDGMWIWKPWGIRGYKGEKIGTIGYGASEQGGIIQCSGGNATDLARHLVASGVSCRCTRIDFQCTGQWNQDCSSYAYKLGKKIAQANKRQEEGRPATHKNIIGWGRGDTFTSGSRVSDRYIRVYDKTREQRENVAANLWRWEVELKRKLASAAWDLVSHGTIGRDLAEGIVVSEVERRGVIVPWVKGSNVEVTSVARPKSDIEKKLCWIRDQVMPTFVLLFREGLGDTLDSMVENARLTANNDAGKSIEPGQEHVSTAKRTVQGG